MLKHLLTFGTVLLLCAAFLDFLWVSGLGRPVSWSRDIFMGAAGLACYYLRIKFRKVL